MSIREVSTLLIAIFVGIHFDYLLVMKKTFALTLLALLSLTTFAQKDNGGIEWISIYELENAMANEPRKVVIDVYTDWCGWCKRMDATTFKNEVIADYVNEKYYAVKLDAEQKDSISFRDHTFKFVKQGKRGYHELAAALLQGKMSYPSIVYLDEELNMIQPVPGYQDAAQFEKVIKYFGGNHYKNKKFEDFQKEFTSSLPAKS